ncbi:MAG TPA: hypothetical protein VMH02_09110 [Verrucomicrobiae bacterium]|nr:hypothetical protein [Verrucomicrobiae bacterium]
MKGRTPFFVAAALAIAALGSPGALLGALATSASVLFEATPFLLLGLLLARFGRREWLAYLGCGCGPGPAASSLPAAAATALVFGPALALARWLAAGAVARLLRLPASTAPGATSLLHDLRELLPAALLAGAASQLVPLTGAARLDAMQQAVAGALLGFASAPCGLGALGIAGTLRAPAPVAAAAFLCVAGIADLRALAGARAHAHAHEEHDAFAYAVLGGALAVVAWRRGDALVHPAIAVALGGCALAAFALLILRRRTMAGPARLAPTLMLAAALCSAPPPPYRANETTMAGLFAGEPLSFTGVLVRDRTGDALVRYAILCCRADASPVAIRLARRTGQRPGSWLHAQGLVRAESGRFTLAAASIDEVASPRDPFLYR